MKIPTGARALILAALTMVPISIAVASTASGTGDANPAPLTVGGPDLGSSVGSTPVVAQKLARRSTITLVTGDRVRLDVKPDGTEQASVLSPSGDAKPLGSTYTGFTWHGDEYVIPNLVAPYLSTLDPRLFDVSYLERAKLDDAHSSTLPVKISYTDAGTGSLQGVHVSSRSGSTGTATVSKQRSRKFGQQLADQWRASRAGTSSLPTGRLSGIDRIELAPASGAPALPATPSTLSTQPKTSRTGLRYHTVTINHVAQDGSPGTAVGFLQNLDHPEVGPWLIADTGTIAFSVPEGTYSVATGIMEGPADDYTVKAALVMNPEFTVSSDQTVTLDARTAKPYQATVEPAIVDELRSDVLTFTRTGVTGTGMKVENAGFAASWVVGMHIFSIPAAGYPTIYAAPTPPVKTGTLDFSAGTSFGTNESLPASKPSYFLVFPHPGGVPTSLNYTVQQSDLAEVHQKTYINPGDDQGKKAQLYYWAALPWGEMSMPINSPEFLPAGEHVDYLYSSAQQLVTWMPTFVTVDDNSAGTSALRIEYGPRRTFHNGEQLFQEWNKGVVTPSAKAPYTQYVGESLESYSDIEVDDPLATICVACRQDDNGMLFLTASDSDPTHTGAIHNATSRFDFYRNGTLALSSDAARYPDIFSPFGLELPMLKESATYRVDWTSRPPGQPAQSTETDWTFHSAAADSAASLPATSQCAPDKSRSCSYLPLLFVRYDLALNELTQAKAGASFDIDFTVTHQEGQAAPTGVTSTVSVSYDDGQTWSAPQVASSQGNNQFHLKIVHPELGATSGFVSLRVEAHDGAGSVVRQTLVHTYALTS